MWDFDNLINKVSMIYGEETNLELIAKYSGNIMEIAENEDVIIEVLNSSFAIITLPFFKIRDVLSYTQINYVEIPKKLTIVQNETLLAEEFYKEPYTCPIADGKYTGKGVMVAILDTGIAYRHEDFRNDDGTTRIMYIWDQSVAGTPPDGFYQGNLYTQAEINRALVSGTSLGTNDIVGHGTMVAGIAVGNGRESDGVYKGIAPDANILVVKLGSQESESFAMITEFMRAIKFAYDMAIKENMPLVINISYGTNDGSHNGDSLFEEYINDMATYYKSNIIVATGNGGDSGQHYESTLMDNETEVIDFTIGAGVETLYTSIWKNFTDDIYVELVTPENNSTGKVLPSNNVNTYNFQNVKISVLYNFPTPYRLIQEIYIQIEFPSYLTASQDWKLIVNSEKVVDGNFKIWLPTTEEVTAATRFRYPSTNTTLMIPSTASNVISVSGYDTTKNRIAPFSGKGLLANGLQKPDISAPAVDVLTTTNLLTYGITSGTSFSAPFVTGACAVLMEYGLIDNNEIFLYGEKMKGYLQKMAKRYEESVYPNRDFGYGNLCIKDTLAYLETLNNTSTPVSSTINEVLINKSDSLLKDLSLLPEINIIKDFDDFVIANVPDNIIEKISNNHSIEKPMLLTTMSDYDTPKSDLELHANNVTLTGKGVLVAIIDIDIDIFDSCFYNDNKSKIYNYYNMESNFEIKNNEIDSMHNYSFKKGHGTELAKVVSAISKDAEFICIELPKTPKNLLDSNCIDSDKNVFSSIDIINAIEYAIAKSTLENKPLSICLALGTNMSAHNGSTIFENYLEKISQRTGVSLCVSAGGEGNKKTHIERTLSQDKTETLQLNICENQENLPIYLYTNNVDYFILQLQSPENEIYLYRPATAVDTTEYTFKASGTKILTNYNFHKQEIIINLKNPTEGMWTIFFTPSLVDFGKLHAYLPVDSLIKDDTYFNSNSSNYSITVPATANSVISVGSYDKKSNEIHQNTGRGPTTDMKIKPTIVAPHTNIHCNIIGTSVSTAEVSAVCALLLEWGIVNKNNNKMNTTTIEKMLINSAEKHPHYSYPNNIEGYGRLSINNIFN